MRQGSRTRLMMWRFNNWAEEKVFWQPRKTTKEEGGFAIQRHFNTEATEVAQRFTEVLT